MTAHISLACCTKPSMHTLLSIAERLASSMQAPCTTQVLPFKEKEALTGAGGPVGGRGGAEHRLRSKCAGMRIRPSLPRYGLPLHTAPMCAWSWMQARAAGAKRYDTKRNKDRVVTGPRLCKAKQVQAT
jgi:hypothetical protein